MSETKGETRRSRQCPIPSCTERESTMLAMKGHMVLDHGMVGAAAKVKAQEVFKP